MSSTKKPKISASAVSASGKLRSPGVDAGSAKSKAKKPAVKTSVRKGSKAKSVTPTAPATVTVRGAADDGIERVAVARKSNTPKLVSTPPITAKMASPGTAATPVAIKPKISTLSSTASKETIYIDIDEEITAIIDRLQRAKGTIVALVLPKRAVVMQSVVNMRLLKRTAEQAGKRLVLVTTESSLLPLAGLVGLFVADTPTSKPAIPPAPDRPSEEPERIDESLVVTDEAEVAAGPEFDQATEAQTPVGTLAGSAPVAAAPGGIDEEVILDDEPADDAGDKKELAPAKPVKKNKKLAIPNFNKFRLYSALGVLGLVLLIIGLVVATKVMPRATIQLKTNSQVISSTLNLTLDTAARSVDTENKIIPAVAQTSPKAATMQATATGQQNNGDEATGTVKFAATMCAPNLDAPSDIPTGTSVTSGGKTYITQEGGNYSFNGTSGSCVKYATNTIDITALKAGAEYNLASNAAFSGPGGASGTGTAEGGTDEIVKIITQGDVDSAKAKIASQDTAQLKQDLAAALQGKGLLPIPSTFIAGESQVTTSAQVGATAETFTVSSTTPYTMLGIKQSDLRPLVADEVNGQIDTDKQQILDDGISKAEYTQQSAGSTTNAVVTAKVRSVAGPELSEEAIKKQVIGKKAGDIKIELGSEPGITDVAVEYSPFWVTVVPSDTKKITVEIAEPTADSGE